jgi:hypothetical protein
MVNEILMDGDRGAPAAGGDGGCCEISAKPDRPCLGLLIGSGKESRFVEPLHQSVPLLGLLRSFGDGRVGLVGLQLLGIDRFADGSARGLFGPGR